VVAAEVVAVGVGVAGIRGPLAAARRAAAGEGLEVRRGGGEPVGSGVGLGGPDWGGTEAMAAATSVGRDLEVATAGSGGQPVKGPVREDLGSLKARIREAARRRILTSVAVWRISVRAWRARKWAEWRSESNALFGVCVVMNRR